jgi:primosomal protein N' (replication factor Y)
LSEKEVVLLHGITGSGKTQLYVKLIADYVAKGNQVLYLLPEIALTAQLIRRLQEYFGGNISIYHSKFNDQERVELWNKVRSGESRIVLGARSALFLPFQQLGLIVVDEEHDPSYKQQDPAPRYNARDAAIYYAHLRGARVVLGSATPSIESYFNAKQLKYGLVHLPERFGGIELPKIELVNTHGMNTRDGKIMISEQLKQAVDDTVQGGKQVILFQNRRGYNPYLICGSCGFIPQCADCDVSLTMHKFSKKLHCHYCGKTYPILVACPACGVQHWLEKNFGTEKVEEYLEEIFPDYKIARMDVDSVRGKNAHDNLIRQFEKQRIDILIGTQMVVKGLDFEHVDLVGIIDADGLLSFADFRVNERAFQLMEQVSGRAGRKHRQGRVLIQAMQVQHPVLQFVLQHNYESFYKMELMKRSEFNYPPFSRLIRITFKHKEKQVVMECAVSLAAEITKTIREVNGPAAPVIGRIRNLYLMELLIKLPRDGSHFNYKRSIEANIQLVKSNKQFASVKIVCDVDPY